MSESAKNMKTGKTSVIQLDKQKINEAIKEKGHYEDEGVWIRKWEGEEETDAYIAKIHTQEVSFIGILNGKFEREGYGINKFENNDEYFGYLESDKRMKHGVYFWNPKEIDNMILTECYYGYWREDKKDNHGIYIWWEEPKDNNQFQNANFDAFIGEIDLDNYKRGSYLSKINDSYFLYHGNIDMNGKKTMITRSFYSAKNDRLIKGKIQDDIFVNGYVTFFDSESGDIKDLVYADFKADGTVDALKKKDEIDPQKIKEVEEIMSDFRGVIWEVDYFGNIYKKYKAIKEFIALNMKTIDVLDDKEKFPKIIELCVGYNDKNIYSAIEKHINH